MKLYYETQTIPANKNIQRHKGFSREMSKKIDTAMQVALNIEEGYVQVITWKKELGADDHLDGFIQVTSRPYKQGYGCDGTTDSNIHLIAKTICESIGIDYIDAYMKSYIGMDADSMTQAIEWISNLKNNPRVVSETIIPVEITLDVLRLVLIDLYQINNRTLVETLAELMIAKGFDVDDYYNHEDRLKAWKWLKN